MEANPELIKQEALLSAAITVGHQVLMFSKNLRRLVQGLLLTPSTRFAESLRPNTPFNQHQATE
jgi:hypothetical protein